MDKLDQFATMVLFILFVVLFLFLASLFTITLLICRFFGVIWAVMSWVFAFGVLRFLKYFVDKEG